MDFIGSSKFDAIIFDLGNTLIYFDGEWGEVLNHAENALCSCLRELGVELDKRSFVESFHDRLLSYYVDRDQDFKEYTTRFILRSEMDARGFLELPEDVLRRGLEAFYAVTQTHWQIEDDTIATLEELRAMELRIGMISNAGDDKDVQTLVDKANIRRYFDKIVTSAEVGIRKPDPYIFSVMLDYWDIPASRAVMVGDTLDADILGARNAGLYSIWIKRRSGGQVEPPIIPDSSVELLQEIPEMLISV